MGVVCELRRLNEALLIGFIDVLNITKQPESYLFDVLKKREIKAVKNKNKTARREPKPLIRHSQSQSQFHSQSASQIAMSQLTPLITDKCESLKESFLAMRD